MKLLAIGIWVTLVALGTAYGVAVYLPALTSPSKAAAAPALLYQKTRVLNVPMVASGIVQGFISLQFGFTSNADALKTLHVQPEVFLLDEAFRAVYSDNALDFNNLAKYDLPKLTHQLVDATNAHLGGPIVKDVLIEQFSYISKDVSKR